MPFTPAHALVALPVAGRLRRTSVLALVALVAGSMAPDAPMFVPLPWGRDQTHSPLGVISLTAALAVVAALTWVIVVAPALRVLAPTAVRQRLRPQPGLRAVDWLAAYPMAVVGGFTHIAWDACTHADGYVVERVAPLRRVVGAWPLYADLQVGSSLVGTAVVLAWIAIDLGRRRPDRRIGPGLRWRALAWIVVLGGALVGAAIGRRTTPNLDVRNDLGVYVLTGAGSMALACLAVVVAAAWSVRIVRSWPLDPATAPVAIRASASAAVS